MIILAIDPGSRNSGYLSWDADREIVVSFGANAENSSLLTQIRKLNVPVVLAIEQIRGYGIVAGDDIFDTCQWSGRFQEAHERNSGKVYMIPRKDVKRHLCGNTTTNDRYIRQALIDRFGGQEKAIGSKKKGCTIGPLYGISGHLWSALAVAITCADLYVATFTPADAKILDDCGI